MQIHILFLSLMSLRNLQIIASDINAHHPEVLPGDSSDNRGGELIEIRK